MVRWLATPALCCASLASSCGETSVDFALGDAQGPPLSVSYLIEGGGADELQSLFLTVRDIRLLRPEDLARGSDGVGSLPARVVVELLGLEGRAKLLTTRYYGDGTFTHVRLDFDAASMRAVRHDGEEVVWQGAGPHSGDADGRNSSLIELDEPFRPVRGASLNHTLILHVHPDESTVRSMDVAGGSVYRFEPAVRARVLRSGDRIRGDDLWGGLLSASGGLESVEIASDSDQTSAERAVVTSVRVEPNTLLLQPNGEPATSLSGLAATAELSAARFWVRGDYIASHHSYLPELSATSLLLDSLNPSSASDAAIVVEARVVGVEASGVFVVRPLEIERGAAAVESALDTLGQPSTWRVQVGSSATVLTVSQSLGSRADLRVGMRVKLHFPSLLAEPFAVARAVVQGRPEHYGHIVEGQVSDNFASVQLDEDAAAIAAGQVADTGTTISVETTSLFAKFDPMGGQFVLVRMLQPGVRTVVRGLVTGTAEFPEIESAALIVRPGRFRGFVSSVSEGDGSFDATVESIDAPFGGIMGSPPFRVTLDASVEFEGAATSRQEFFELFSALASGERLGVTVLGLGAATPNEVNAYQIRIRVE